MPKILRHAIATALASALLSFSAIAAPENALPLALRGVNPDMLSGATFAALDAQGAFGMRGLPPRAAAVYPNLSKGRAGAVLEPRVGPNIRLGDDADQLPPNLRGQAEPHIYRSAGNPDVLLACFQEGRFAVDGGAVSCGYAVSRDGGLTWTRSLVPRLTTASGGTYLRATDPVAAIGPQGELYLNNLASVDNAFGLAGIVVSRSTDNGATWTNPIVVFQSTTPQVFPDKNWFVVNDYPGTANPGRLVVTWTNFTSNAAGQSTGNNIATAVSDDRGATWTTPIAVTPAGSNNQGSQPVFLPDGSLGIVYITFLGSTLQFNVQFKRSTDGGRTFPATANTVVGFVSGWDDPEMRDGVFLPSATVARTTGEFFVTYTTNAAGTPRVMFTKSSDLGVTWSAPIAASDNPDGSSVMNPAVAVTPDGRTVSIVFMDKRLAPGGRGFVDHFAALSFDGGATWQPNVRLSEISSDISYGPPTARGIMLGDYLGVAPSLAPDQPLVAVWCDTRTGDSDPFAVRFVPGAATDFATWARVRNVPAIFQLDTDSDGVLNEIEFLDGTDPRSPQSGEALFIRNSGPDTIDVAWTERANAETGERTSAVYFLTDANATSINVAPPPPYTSSPSTNPIPANQLPQIRPRDGLVWKGVRAVVPGARAIVRAIQVTRGQTDRFVGEPVAAINTDARLINISSRGQVRPAGGELIVGFVINGNKSMLIRAAGPSLASLGVSHALADPRLRLEALASDLIVTNDNWQQNTSPVLTMTPTVAMFNRLGAFPFEPNSLDAGLVMQLGIQAYTAIVSSVTATPGIALVEAYDADATPGAPANPRLLNLSTRADVGTGENALIAGFVLNGTQPRRVLIRAIGPTLANFDVPRTLADPLLTLYRGETQIAQNDDWEISRSGAAIAATAQRVGAFALNAASLDAALLITLAPGAYTAVVTGVDGTTGVALVEVYDAD